MPAHYRFIPYDFLKMPYTTIAYRPACILLDREYDGKFERRVSCPSLLPRHSFTLSHRCYMFLPTWQPKDSSTYWKASLAQEGSSMTPLPDHSCDFLSCDCHQLHMTIYQQLHADWSSQSNTLIQAFWLAPHSMMITFPGPLMFY